LPAEAACVVNDPVLASRVFGIYLVASGISFAGVPAIALPLVGLAMPADVWVRVVGLLSAILGMYFLYCAQADQRRFFQATVIARLMFFSGVTTFVLIGLASPVFVLFGVVDLLGAGWMQLALHATRSSVRTG